jgi:hypothetical protein
VRHCVNWASRTIGARAKDLQVMTIDPKMRRFPKIVDDLIDRTGRE